MDLAFQTEMESNGCFSKQKKGQSLEKHKTTGVSMLRGSDNSDLTGLETSKIRNPQF